MEDRYCNQCKDLAYCAEHKVCLEAGQEWPKKWAEMTKEEKYQFYLDIFANPSGYANPERPFYC